MDIVEEHVMRSSRLAVVVVAGLFAACTGSARHRSDGVAIDASPRAVALAASRTAAGGTGRFETTIVASTDAGRVSLAATGAFDVARRRFTMTIAVPTFFSAAAACTPLVIIVTGDTLYVDCPHLADLVDARTKWISVRSTAADLVGLPLADPAELLDLLQGAVGSVDRVGTEDVRGEPTTHLVTEIDGTPVHVFVAGDGLVRRITMDFDAPEKSGSVLVSSQYFDVGAPVTIDPPPVGDVTDATDAARRLFGGTTGG